MMRKISMVVVLVTMVLKIAILMIRILIGVMKISMVVMKIVMKVIKILMVVMKISIVVLKILFVVMMAVMVMKITMLMTQERLMIAVHSVATCEATFEMTREWVKERKAFGGRVADLQTVQVLAGPALQDLVSRHFSKSALSAQAGRDKDEHRGGPGLRGPVHGAP